MDQNKRRPGKSNRISGKDAAIEPLEAKINILEKEIKSFKAIQRSFLNQEAEYAEIFDTMGVGIAYASLKGKIRSINRSFEQILGIPKEEIIGKNILALAAKLLQPGEAKNVIALLLKLIGGSKIKPFQVNYRDKILEVNTGLNPKTRKLTGTIRDITGNKQIEEQLTRKNIDLSRLFDMSLLLLESLEKKKVLIKIVEYAANLVGTDSSAIYLIHGGADLFLEATFPPLPPDYPDEFRYAKLVNHPHIKEAIETRATVIIPDVSKTRLSKEEKLIVETRDFGSLVYIPLFVEKRVEGVIILGTIGRKHDFKQHEIDLFSTFSNITSLALENSYLFDNLNVTKEKAEESNRLKTAFLHNISHEIRTPLNAIIGFSDFISQNDLASEAKHEYTNIISQANMQLLSIIDDIINISHIEAGQVKVVETRVDLNKILRNIKSQYSAEAIKKGIKFKMSTSFPGHEIMIMTDENKLLGVLTNLLNNAFKFTHEGSVVLECTVSDDFIEFLVSDTGIGIHESEHDKIFDRFYQIDKSSTRLYRGMGLGLSICLAYANLLGGRITLQSFPGKGSNFAFAIPYKKAVPTYQPAVKSRATHADPLIAGKTILVAEDEDTSFAFISEILTAMGVIIIRANNGLDAIAACESHPEIDLILMDIRMPLKNGYDSAAEIHKIKPAIPIIAQTAYGYPLEKSHAMLFGYRGYIAKPFTKEQLISVIVKHLLPGTDF